MTDTEIRDARWTVRRSAPAQEWAEVVAPYPPPMADIEASVATCYAERAGELAQRIVDDHNVRATHARWNQVMRDALRLLADADHGCDSASMRELAAEALKECGL